MAETDIDETLYSCDCVKQKGKYDLSRALSEIEAFLNENNFRDYNNNSVASVADEDNNS